MKNEFLGLLFKAAGYLRLGRLFVSSPRDAAVLYGVRKEALTYLNLPALLDLYTAVKEIEQKGTEGAILECGCALGGSALVITAAKAATRTFRVYDAFGMIPPPSERDGRDAQERYELIRAGLSPGLKGRTYYGYQENLYETVVDTFQRYGFDLARERIELIKGLYQDVLSVNEPIALLHLDSDWYDSVMVCLTRVVPHLAPGGRIIVDDYDEWSGCRRAIHDFFSNHPEKDRFQFEMHARLHILYLEMS